MKSISGRWESNFNKVAGLRPPILLKKRLWHRCFSVNFVKYLRTPFLQNTSGRLLLILIKTICKVQNESCDWCCPVLFQRHWRFAEEWEKGGIILNGHNYFHLLITIHVFICIYTCPTRILIVLNIISKLLLSSIPPTRAINIWWNITSRLLVDLWQMFFISHRQTVDLISYRLLP